VEPPPVPGAVCLAAREQFAAGFRPRAIYLNLLNLVF
jgi:hypothetical protein